MTEVSPPNDVTRTKVEGRVASAAIVSAATAFACGVCCALPFALPSAVLAFSGALLAWFGRMFPWAALIAVGVVGGSWLWIAVQSYRAKRKPARPTLVTLSLAALILAAGLLWPQFEENDHRPHSQLSDEGEHN